MFFWGYMIIFLLLPFDFGYGKAWAKNEIKPVEENLSIKNTTQRSLKFERSNPLIRTKIGPREQHLNHKNRN